MTESTFHATHADTETCHSCKLRFKTVPKKRKMSVIHHFYSGQNAEKVFSTHDSYKIQLHIHIK